MGSCLVLRSKLITLLVLMFLVSIGCVVTADSDVGTVVKVEPSTSCACTGEVFTINVSIINVENLYGLEISLYWNASVLEVMGVDVRLGEPDGVLHKDIAIVADDLTQGGYLLAATSQSPASSFNGSGTMVRISFNATGSGGSELNLASELYDYPPPDREPRVSWPIAHTTIDGLVIPEFPAILVLLICLIAVTLMLVLARRFRPFREVLLAERESRHAC